MSDKHPYLGSFRLAPVAPGLCPQCAVDHPPEQPHNMHSLAYQYDFYGKNGRWPTWTDAMAHCRPDIQFFWKEELTKMGQKL